MKSALPNVPVVDVRDGGTLLHARECRERALALRETQLTWFPKSVRPLIPILDAVAQRWLTRSQSPYVEEVRAVADVFGFPGVWFLNSSYQWSCTSIGREEAGLPWLARTLDWHLPGLGRYADVARMTGPAGEFCSVTWPGYVGVLTALAPMRFAAAINQAPLRRYTRHATLRPFDAFANTLSILRRSGAIPPDQLLRRVFETAHSYAEAQHLLRTTRIARPVIFTLVGCRTGERCVIERTEDGERTRSDNSWAANDWFESTPPWEARVHRDKIWSSSFEEAAETNCARQNRLAQWSGSFERDTFGWVAPPVLNACTRIAAEMCPGRGILRVVGYELAAGGELAEPVTMPCAVFFE